MYSSHRKIILYLLSAQFSGIVKLLLEANAHENYILCIINLDI